MSIDTALAGGTGLTGSNILAALSSHPSIKSISAFARRDFASPTSPKLHPLIDSDGTKWAALLPPRLQEGSGSYILFSALGTTRGKVGGLTNQYKIDHDLPVSLAKSFASSPSKERKVFVLISSANANSGSWNGYIKMKGETEDEIKSLVRSDLDAKEGIDNLIIIRPGLIVGTRREEDSRPPEFVIRKIAGLAGHVSNGLKDFWAQDAEVIGRAAVNAAVQIASGKRDDKVWTIAGSEIIRLGRTEWEQKEG